jgi:multisubunit Na+/H+ antiporter MnhB subunit
VKGMSLIVKTITNIVIGFIFVYGVYIILHGHLTPGGGFAGGVIIAGTFILKFIAFGGGDIKDEKRGSIKASLYESIGALLFIGIAILGLLLAGTFFLNFLPKGTPFHLLSAGIIPFCNIAISIKVGAGLFSIFLALAAIKYIMED